MELVGSWVEGNSVVAALHTAWLALKLTSLCHNCYKNADLREPWCRRSGKTVLNLLTSPFSLLL